MKDGVTMESSDKSKHEAWVKRRERSIAALAWLCETFPQTFNMEHPQPLKIRILQDIVTLSRDKISRSSLRMALSFYTSRRSYRKALIQGYHRVDLQGTEVEEVKDPHKEHAQKCLDQMKGRRKMSEVPSKTPDSQGLTS